MQTTTTAPNHAERLTWLLDFLGAEEYARSVRDLTATEKQMVDAALARSGDDPVAALAPDFPNLPADVQAEIRRVMQVPR